MPRQKAATTKKRITRGPRKGQVIEVYAKSGTEVKKRTEVVAGTGRNRSKGNPRRGQDYTETIDRKGREVHRYADGTSVTLRGKRAAAVRGTKAVRTKGGQTRLTTKQRQAAVNAQARKAAAPKKKPAARRRRSK